MKDIKKLIEISDMTGRTDWVEKNQIYLENLEGMRNRILQEGIVHKNGKLREDVNG